MASASATRLAIASACRLPEAELVPSLLAAVRLAPAQRARIDMRARALVRGMRGRRPQGVEALLRRFPMASARGTALMGLAEALLRVPDAATAEQLLRDKLRAVDWSDGLLSRVIGWAAHAPGVTWQRRAAQRLLRHLSRQFVYGETMAAALVRMRRDRARGYSHSFDMLGEAAVTAADAQRYFAAYEQALHAIGALHPRQGPLVSPSVSVKLSALHPRYQYSQEQRLRQELLPRLRALAGQAKAYDLALTIDAEESERLELSLDMLEALALDPELCGWDGLGIAVQAYQKRAPLVIDYLVQLARRSGHRLMVRLVKGAYWDSEIKRAQLDGVSDFPVYTRKAYTDVAYLACAKALLAHAECVFPQFATHNAHTVAAVIELGPEPFKLGDYEFQCLFGMGAALYDQIVHARAGARPCRIYAPVGEYSALLAYLMRRLFENGASASFLHQLNAAVPVEALVADPLAQALQFGARSSAQVLLPAQLFAPERRNSTGLDLTDAATRQRLLAAVERGRDVPRVSSANIGWVTATVSAAAEAAPEWAATAVAARAALLERASDLFEQHHEDLVALAVAEAGKTLPAALAEVREAVDYLRYYGGQARAVLADAEHAPLGTVACISPWNFPIAIFTGQVAAALAAGNSVIAKPAEQTPAIAQLCVRLLHRAGIPAAVLQLLAGDGKLGARLVADARVQGVVFTGSTQTAKSIERELARRAPTSLIAETGGQNAMIVDSSALPEQVVADVLTSAFDSAGQRCSALRVLCVQREIADVIVSLLEGAMRELRVGEPGLIATDVGPMIDAEARERVQAHIERMRRAGRVRYQSPLPALAGHFLPPTLIEIDAIGELTHEVFGPVLHLLRFERRQLGALLEAINASGYGLTLGIHSRMDATTDYILEHARVGNVYVNRNMIGAVVGVQPFGGRGLSGTGPKAGGPLYLRALLRRAPPLEFDAVGPPVELAAWLKWLSSAPIDAQVRRTLLQQAQRYQRDSLLQRRLTLPGAVGERNELRWRARGVVLGTARSLEAALHQFSAALVTGNGFQIGDASVEAALLPHLPAELRRWLRPREQASDAVLVAAEDARARPPWLMQMRQALAARDGAIIPMIEAAPDYALERLLYEQSVSVNTAAVGGNAAFLAAIAE